MCIPIWWSGKLSCNLKLEGLGFNPCPWHLFWARVGWIPWKCLVFLGIPRNSNVSKRFLGIPRNSNWKRWGTVKYCKRDSSRRAQPRPSLQVKFRFLKSFFRSLLMYGSKTIPRLDHLGCYVSFGDQIRTATARLQTSCFLYLRPKLHSIAVSDFQLLV